MLDILTFLTILSLIILIAFFFFFLMKKKKKDNPSLFSIGILTSISVLLLIVTITYSHILKELEHYKPSHNKEHKISYGDIGPYGDYIGGTINPVIAFIAVIATGCAFFVQYKANIEFKNQFNIQQDRDNEQNFQNQLFKILDFHHNIIDNIYINTSTIELNKYKYILQNFPYLPLNIKKNNYIVKTIEQEEVILSGRYSFKFTVDLIEETIRIIELTDKFSKKSDKNNINQLYVSRKLNNLNDYIKDNFVKEKIKLLKSNNQDYLPYIINDLFSHKQFTHYFTNLNRALKIINRYPFKENNFQKEYYYASIVRAQLSEQELKLVFLNSIIIGDRYKDFIQKYTLLKNLDLDNDFYKKYNSALKRSAYVTGNA